MFALRALFWLGIVSVLVPHEPDLGFGRPTDAGGMLRQAIVREFSDVRIAMAERQTNSPRTHHRE
jgi:hypothetical protein